MIEKKDVFINATENTNAEQLYPGRKCLVSEIDGADIKDKASMMKAVAAAFHFPDYFGENWDALADCLRDLPEEMEEYDVFVLSIRNYRLFLAESPVDHKDFEETFMDAASFIEEAYGKKLSVLVFL